MHILLADDDGMVRRIASLCFKKSGHEIVTVADGAEALESAKRDKPDLIILDGLMPTLNGIETCQALKTDPTTQNIPVIFLSAITDPEEKQKFLNCGGIGVISKPFTPASLQEQFQTFLSAIKS